MYDFILTEKPYVATLHSRATALDGLGYLFVERYTALLEQCGVQMTPADMSGPGTTGREHDADPRSKNTYRRLLQD